ncbi:MAG: hypothetical protein LBU39_03725 [Desulfobulbaceae bacterium]|jgi:hypothetical protein|nr:hypothetical protein [Desulfobulbaceae bacterium]
MGEGEEKSAHTNTPPVLILKQEAPQTFDPAALVNAAQGAVSEKGKGFIPATDFPATKPYEDWKDFLDKQHQDIARSGLNPDRYVEDIKKAHEDNQARREEHFRQRNDDLERYTESRFKDLQDYHGEILRRRDEKIDELEKRLHEEKTENKNLERQRDEERDRLLEASQRCHEQRIADLERHHAAELALTERISQFVQDKLRADEERMREAKDQLDQEKSGLVEEKKRWFDTLIQSVKDFKLTQEIFK